MPRVKIELPGHFSFKMQLRVRITDLNYGKHVGNDKLVAFLHEARVQWLQSLGFTELEFGTASLIMADLAVEYLAELFVHDLIVVDVAVSDITRVGFNCYYQITKANNGEEIIVAKAKTGMLCFDYEKRKVVSIPTTAAEVLKKTL